jgi:formylmethanofuran dehydrogenase subunit C
MEMMEGMVVVDGTVEALITGVVEELIADLLDVEEGSSSIPYKKI